MLLAVDAVAKQLPDRLCIDRISHCAAQTATSVMCHSSPRPGGTITAFAAFMHCRRTTATELRREVSNHHAALAMTLNWRDAPPFGCPHTVLPRAKGTGAREAHFSAGGTAGWMHHLRRVPVFVSSGPTGTFPTMTHYRFYELDHSDHIGAGYSVECGSDTDALRAAGRLPVHVNIVAAGDL